MQKRFKTVGMMLFLMGAISGTAVAAPTYDLSGYASF